jgi:hypothetical protein
MTSSGRGSVANTATVAAPVGADQIAERKRQDTV